jgi:hypothetical protein
MKKQLLNQKRVSQLFFSLCFTLLSVNSISSQTVLDETFGSAAIAAPYTGGTSTTPSAITYTQGSNGNISTVLNVADAYLNFASNGTNGKPHLTTVLPGIASGLDASSLTSNTKLVTWTVNMRVSRTMSSSSQTYVDGSNYLAVVLCSSNPNLVDGTVSGSVGYALILQRSLDNVAALNPGAIRLVKFQNGIGASVATGSVVSAALLTTPALNAGAAATAAAPNNVSIKVEYNANFDSWTMYYREDPITGGFADPSTGAYTKIGSVTDATHTSTAMTHFGYLASVGTGASAANQYQIDNFKIALSTFPAFTPTPNIERRQVIHNSPSPTVASLANVGTNVKYYAAATGGSPLLSTTPITSGYYYVTQTIGLTESDRLPTYVYIGDTTLKSLPIYEPFNYPLSTATTASTDNKLVLINNDLASGTGYGPWSVAATALPAVLSPDDLLLVAQPATWTSSVLPVPTGNALTFAGSGLDPQLLFAAPTSGSVYASCLLQVTNLNNITSASSGSNSDTPSAPDQVFSFAYADSAAGSTTSYTAAVYLKSSTVTPGAFNIGINAAPAEPIGATDIVWSSTDFAVNTPITLVIQYSYDDKISKLWIDPTSTAEPVASATTLARALPLAVNRVRLTQGANARTPFVTIDEIRVANNFSYVTGGSNLGVKPLEITSKFAAYPNPVRDGKLYISSSNANEKQVSIYSILGQKVIDVKTNNNTSEINVSKLSKGNYILRISEAGKSEAKKLIIQ